MLSASSDGTARVWDLRTSKGAILLKHSGEKQAIIKAKYNYGAKGVLTVSGNCVNLFDLRKPSLILTQTQVAGDKANSDEINDIEILDLPEGSP